MYYIGDIDGIITDILTNSDDHVRYQEMDVH
jgi:hypothetical protein